VNPFPACEPRDITMSQLFSICGPAWYKVVRVYMCSLLKQIKRNAWPSSLSHFLLALGAFQMPARFVFTESLLSNRLSIENAIEGNVVCQVPP